MEGIVKTQNEVFIELSNELEKFFKSREDKDLIRSIAIAQNIKHLASLIVGG